MLNYRSSAANTRGAASLMQQSGRRRLTRRRLHEAIAWHSHTASEPAREVLRNTLRSACEVIGAERGFILQTREDPVLEVVGTHGVKRQDLLDLVIGCASPALHRALIGGELGLADRSGVVQPQLDGSFEENAPAVVALPLELSGRQRGVLCLLRNAPARVLSELDIEILEALADQAALALRAASQESALSRLAASLQAFTTRPA